MRILCHFLIALIVSIGSVNSFSAEVVIDGSAPVRDGDIGMARELAVRRAMARAAESHSAIVNSQTVVRPGSVLEIAQLHSSACTGESQLLSEIVKNGELTVTLRVNVNAAGSCVPVPMCQPSYVNKIVVLGFGFEFPDQILASERSTVNYKTAGEVARMLRKHQHLLVDFEDLEFPYLSPAEAPEPYVAKAEKETSFVRLARRHRGQYVLSGVYRDFGLGKNNKAQHIRRIEVEVFLHDGANGSLLDKHTFTNVAVGDVTISESPPLGSIEFYRTDFGKAWGTLLEQVARWSEEKVSCLPFVSRVVKTEGKQIYIDAGAESGLSVGDTMNLHLWRNTDIRSVDDHHLGKEKEFQTTASLKSVYPRFSVMQLIEKPDVYDKVRVGDLLYSR